MSGLPSFRKQRVQKLLAEVLREQRRRQYGGDFRVVHYSIQSNHVHLLVEADTESARGSDPLRSGVSGLAIAFARRLNLMLRRKGKVWADRYHRHDLKTPKETWYGLSYLFNNYTHHGARSFGEGVLDPYSSACLFGGWDGPHFVPVRLGPVAMAGVPSGDLAAPSGLYGPRPADDHADPLKQPERPADVTPDVRMGPVRAV